MSSGIVIQGVWLRTIKSYPKNDRGPTDSNHESTEIEVLVEVNGTWRRVIEETDAVGSGPISHIAETAGIVRAPVDPVTS